LIILKNAYVLTFNRNNDFGKYSLLINESKITDIADSTPAGEQKVKKWVEQHSGSAEIIDCSKKLIMPPLVNSCVKSEGALLHYLLKHRHYENVEEELCTDLIFNYIYQELPGEEAKQDLENIYRYSYNRLLKSGITCFNELSLRKDINHIAPISSTIKKTGQRVSVCFPIKQDVNLIRDFKYLNPSYYLTQEHLLTVFDVSGINELRSHNVKNLFLEVALNKEITEKFRQTFHKSVVSLLDEYGLVDENTSLINPLYLDYSDLKIITDRKANIIICPRDLNYFTSRYFPIDDFIGHGIRFTIGTGWLGEDLLKDVRLFRNKYKELNLSNIELLRSITSVPREIYFSDSSESTYGIDVNRTADMIFIDLNDTRFQFFPEEFTFESVCDFVVDNVLSFNFSDVLTAGRFRMKDGKQLEVDEREIIEEVNLTRNRLYKTGKYEELKKRKEQKQSVEKMDMGGRNDEEIKLFSENKENEVPSVETEEFKIKTKIPVFRQRPIPGQKSLFEQSETANIIQAEEFQETPVLNLLVTDPEADKPVENEFVQAKIIDETIIRSLHTIKKADKTQITQNEESKIELPKNVKLKFGDD
jgi:Amidohydrolase family